jgi:predicted nucleic acid-binding protein
MNYIFDTNAVIDLLEGKLPVSSVNKLTNTIAEVSVISKIELLGYHRITFGQKTAIDNFLSYSILHPLTDDIIDKCIQIRKLFNIKTPDAIIAATALVYNVTLLSRNLKDFGKITGLSVLDPYTL